MHVGSHFGICPLKWTFHEGSVHLANPGQKYLYEVFNQYLLPAIKEKYGKVDALVINGDACEGRGRTYTIAPQVITTDSVAQSRAATKILKPAAELAKKVYLVRGTEVHDESFGEAVEQIGERLGAQQFVDGSYSAMELLLDVDGFVFHFAHHIGSSQIPFYRAQQITRELVQAAILAEKIHSAKVIVRSHVHYYHESSSAGHWGFTTPSFCLQTPYMLRKSPLGFIPHIGAIIVEIEKDDCYNPVTIKRFLFPLPKKELMHNHV